MVSILASASECLRPVAPLLIAAGLLAGCSNAQTQATHPVTLTAAVRAQPAPVTTDPWLETMVSVTDLDTTARFFREIGGYETLATGQIPSDELAALGLASDTSAEYLVLRAPGSSHGYIRLVRFDVSTRRVPTRPGARAWDTGCYWSIMVRVKGMESIFDEAIALGWWTHTPITYLEFGESRLNVVVFQGPDGLQVQGYERLGQPLPEGFPPFERLSQPFNLMQMVRDREAFRHLAEDVLGFDRFWYGLPYTDPVPTDMPLGIPRNLTTSVPYKAAIFYPAPLETGRLEAIEIEGLDGFDYADRCKAPNLGILSVSYPVNNAVQARDLIADRGGVIEIEPYDTDRPPWGRVRIFAIRAPDGGLMEFVERL